MVCNRCGNKVAYRMHFSSEGSCCDLCGNLRPVSLGDVYFRKPYLDPHLIDVNNPLQKDGVWIESKEHKKKIMDKLGVKEAGDRVHGARSAYRRMEGGWNV